jgi:hypothetical protein
MTRDPEAYSEWQRKLRDWQPEFDKTAYPKAALHTAKVVAWAFGSHTDFGEQRIAVGDATIGRELGLDRHTVARYRELLLDYGVLIDAGTYRRAMKAEPGEYFHDPLPSVLAKRQRENRGKVIVDDPWAGHDLVTQESHLVTEERDLVTQATTK